MNSSLTELSNEYLKTVSMLDEKINLKKKNLDKAHRKGLNCESGKLHNELVLLRNMRAECYEIAMHLQNYYVKGDKRNDR